MAERVIMGLDEHDRLIAYVLGLSHALNIAFFSALAASGEAAPRLAQLSSTTFDAQLEVAAQVSRDSPQLYYEIQSLNEYGADSLDALARAVEQLRAAIRNRNETAFIEMMLRGREYLAGRTTVRRPGATGT
jgi:chorismate mutase/prephenate dehydrogenase